MKGVRAERGVSYVEVLVAAAVIAAALVPAMESLSTALTATAVHEDLTASHYHLDTRMTELLAEPFAALDAEAQAVADPGAATSYSDAPGATRRRLVYLSRYDGDNADADADPFTGIDAGLLWIRVEIENTVQAWETLRGQ